MIGPIIAAGIALAFLGLVTMLGSFLTDLAVGVRLLRSGCGLWLAGVALILLAALMGGAA